MQEMNVNAQKRFPMRKMAQKNISKVAKLVILQRLQPAKMVKKGLFFSFNFKVAKAYKRNSTITYIYSI